MAELRGRDTTLSVQLAALGAPALALSPGQAADAVGAMLQLWPQATVAERGRMLRGVVARVVVRRAAFWREPEWERVTVEFL